MRPLLPLLTNKQQQQKQGTTQTKQDEVKSYPSLALSWLLTSGQLHSVAKPVFVLENEEDDEDSPGSQEH